MADAPFLSPHPRLLAPSDIVLGAIWIAPGGGEQGDGARGDPGQDNATATISAAIAHGIREFDTAPWYGAGASEERLGGAIAALSEEQRQTLRVGTKAGRLYTEADGREATSPFGGDLHALRARVCTNDYSAAGARRSLAASLARLGVPRVHTLRIHDPNDNSNNRRGDPHFADEVAEALGEGGMVDALRAMRDEGAISQVGLGMNCNRMPHQGVPEEIARLVTGAPQGTFDSALLAGGWNLLSQDGLATLQLCARRGVAVHVAGVFASGLLVGGDTFAYKAAPPEVVDRARRWGELAAAHGHDLPAVAVAFAALPAVVTRVVVGMASPGQVEQTLAWVEQSRQVGGEVWRAAKQAGLLDASLPTPPPPPNPAGGSPRAAAPLLPAPASLPTCPPAAPLGVDGVVARLEELRGWCSAGTWRAALALVAGEAPVEESPLGQAAGMEERCERAEAALREARVAQHVAAHDAVGAASHCRRSVKELVSLHRALDASLAAMEGNAVTGGDPVTPTGPAAVAEGACEAADEAAELEERRAAKRQQQQWTEQGVAALRGSAVEARVATNEPRACAAVREGPCFMTPDRKGTHPRDPPRKDVCVCLPFDHTKQSIAP
eukprot:CAMPEP_0185286098 /NCGR_PEP_ID=MMETSP1363-20130426/2077_1 /TAXON_ID=38817 /ORGANISM="Gephyrocapsa oceanica, Strain RCC1303" /LENGTH=609 /DNA_ID=CAMNT_0027881895 /DNA_START=97 /DNA_END=1926 /DNA_ORIENTATION=+